MPNIKSAKKRVKTSKRNTERNTSQKSAMRTAIRAVRDLVANGDKKDAEAKMPAAYSLIDKAVKRNVIHKNAAARLKSRLAARLK